ncbi:MAG TPA: tetratricopeptide repeat protein, partial [Rubrobacter sp.]|nr:tetratricopeptide repeat protein [Rubrobacter sp.]
QPTPPQVKVLEGMGWLLQSQGDPKRAEVRYKEMLELSRELDDIGSVATALNSLGTLAVQQGDNERAKVFLEENLSVLEELEVGSVATKLKRFHAFNLLGILAINEERDYERGATLWEKSLALAREVGDPYRIGTTLSNLGHAALMQRAFEQARALCEEALEFAHELGSTGMEHVPSASINLGLASLGLGEYERAAASFENALLMSQKVGRKSQVIESLEGMAGLAIALGVDTRAARLWGTAEAAREATGIALPPGEGALHEPYLADARSRLGKKVWEDALAEGRAMALDQAIEYALLKEKPGEEADPTPAPPRKPGVRADELTPREREVAVLVARGLTNRQVSISLGISERTAANHVAKILGKLGLRSRAQIASWATEHQLLAPDQN